MSGASFGAPINAELVAAAIDVVAAHGDEAWFDRFVDRYRAGGTPQEELRYINAMTRFTDPDLQDRLLEMLVTEVRTQNAPYVLAMSLANPVIGTRAWAFMRDRWSDLVDALPRQLDLADGRRRARRSGIPRRPRTCWTFFAVPRVPHSERPIATAHGDGAHPPGDPLTRARPARSGAVGRDGMIDRGAIACCFAVEPDAAQLNWSALPRGEVTVDCGGATTRFESDGGPGAVDVVLDGPSEIDVRVDGRRALAARHPPERSATGRGALPVR